MLRLTFVFVFHETYELTPIDHGSVPGVVHGELSK